MNSKFKISIPKPCHENWNTMTPKEKGRFCGSCAKTVVDFTKKTTTEIQDYLVENKNQGVCGHFYKKQLDTIVIEIPQTTFQQQLSYQKLFILALFFVMGTTLFSCQYADGKKQKIENVIIKDSIKIIEEDIGLIIPIEKTRDSIKSSINKDSISNTLKKTPPPPPATVGITICETNPKGGSLINLTTTGDVIEVIETTGEVALEEGDIEITVGMIDPNYEPEKIGFIVIEETPKFKEAKNFSKENAKKDFDKRIQNFVKENFDPKLTENLGLSERKYRILTQFTIDKTGNVTDIKVRAPHPKLKEEVTRMLQKLPQFIPGKQGGKVVKTRYSLPISFIVE